MKQSVNRELTFEELELLNKFVEKLCVTRRRLLELYELSTTAQLELKLGPMLMAILHLAPFLDSVEELEEPSMKIYDLAKSSVKEPE